MSKPPEWALELARKLSLCPTNTLRAIAIAQVVEERVAGAIEVLVADEVISSSRARELHGMTPEQQRDHWRKMLGGTEVNLAAEIVTLRSRLDAASNLLAAIHGDGGHYETEHGTEKACADAQTKWYGMRARLERYEAALWDKSNPECHPLHLEWLEANAKWMRNVAEHDLPTGRLADYLDGIVELLNEVRLAALQPEAPAQGEEGGDGS